tara:strand:+ start:2056 stop:2487 length:432 start_codon:yes stop_codon:yes gene_type:complete
MNNKTNTNNWKEQLKEKNLLTNIKEDVKQQFDELLESRDKFLDELDDFTKMMESLYEIGNSIPSDELKFGFFGDHRITDEEKIFLRSLPSRPDLWNSREEHMGWKEFVNKIKDFTDHSLNTDYRVFLEDNKLGSGKYGWDFTE